MFFLHILILYHLLEEVIFTLYYLYTTTKAFMRTGSYDCPKQYQDVIKNCLKSYAEEIYGIIQANHYNLDLTRMVFMGGGSSIVEHFGANEGKDVQFVTDIHANARGCEEAVKSIIRAKQRKMRTA